MKKHYLAFQSDIPSQYEPKEAEDKWYKLWEDTNIFSAKVSPSKKPFCITIPPPNVTGILHMGHALNNTIQDILIRYHRMKGEESLWVPGTDHAGIATQNVVEKAIAKEGLRRQDLGREEFIKRVWQWKQQYGSTIIRQLKRLGSSCDWSRLRFTMDEEYSKAVSEVFVRLHQKGLIYQGNYIINWCPRCQTALSDEEAHHKELQGHLYYIRYPFKPETRNQKPETRNKTHNSKLITHNYIVVATTRPETMLGDTAVAVNPNDKRYKQYIGRTLILPLINREIKIIADEMVDMKFGTGAVKVTPAHDPNDYILAKKHNLEFINIMHPDGTLNHNAARYEGMDRFRARAIILEALKEKGLLEKAEPHQLSAGHCYRCHTIIEPYLSRQWFVKMKPLAEPAITAVKEGRIKFYPKRWTKVYLNWMENIKDWCISRQIWWGHRLPVYYCRNCVQETGSQCKVESVKCKEKGVIVSRIKPEKCPVCGSRDIYQDEDVLDTWFSSWLWPFATFGWPFSTQISANLTQINADKSATLRVQSANIRIQKSDLDYFYPTSVLVTAPEIIFFWVARMVMAGMEFMKDIPFRDVYIHGTVRDITGKKMSKSLGNIIDPIDVINEYGADALRFSIISITAVGQDIFLSKDKFELGRNFANKLWNASRFVLTNLKKELVDVDLCVFFKDETLTLPHRWLLSRLYTTLDSLNRAFAKYNFNEAANVIYRFFWHEFCDWYLEFAKQSIEEKKTQVVLYKTLEKSLRMLHPFMPFITEELWQRLNQSARAPERQRTSIMTQPWPHLQRQMIDKKAGGEMQLIIEVISAIRNICAEFNIPQDKMPEVIISIKTKKIEALFNENLSSIAKLTRCSRMNIGRNLKRPQNAASSFLKEVSVFIPLIGVIDMDKELNRLSAQIEETEKMLLSISQRLKNKDFLTNAPQEVVDKENAKKKTLAERLSALKKNLAILK